MPHLPPGLYKVTFETPAGEEHGVVYLHPDGRLRGGDSSSAYVGKHTQDGPLFAATMSVTQHRHVPGAVAALGLHNVLVELTGLAEEGATVRLEGTSPESAAVRFAARLALIAD